MIPFWDRCCFCLPYESLKSMRLCGTMLHFFRRISSVLPVQSNSMLAIHSLVWSMRGFSPIYPSQSIKLPICIPYMTAYSVSHSRNMHSFNVMTHFTWTFLPPPRTNLASTDSSFPRNVQGTTVASSKRKGMKLPS